jgi:hypothetical protein
MSNFSLSLIRADDPKMTSARLFASSVYLERHEAANETPPDWTILLEDGGAPCATFSVFDPETHHPLFFSTLFEKQWQEISASGKRSAEAGARAIAKRDDPIFTGTVPIILAGALALGMEYMGYASFVCVADRLLARLARSIGVSCVSFGRADPGLLPVETAHLMRNYFAAGPCGYEVCQTIDSSVLIESFEAAILKLRVNCNSFTSLCMKTGQ